MKTVPKFITSTLHAILPLSVFHALRRRHRMRKMYFKEPRIISRNYCGHDLKIKIADANSADWYDREDSEDGLIPELGLLKKHGLRRGGIVFDVGSHTGVIACVFAREVGPEGKVVAVESDPFTAENARANAELNDARNLTVVTAVALSAMPDMTKLGKSARIVEWSGAGSGVTTIDQLAAQHGTPNLVYLDVDGYECEVLRGATNVLASPATWFVEIHINKGLEREGGSLAEVLRHFPVDRYTLQIASPHTDDYQPFDPASPILKNRFFMLACPRCPACG